jgi:hypothetical protein
MSYLPLRGLNYRIFLRLPQDFVKARYLTEG